MEGGRKVKRLRKRKDRKGDDRVNGEEKMIKEERG